LPALRLAWSEETSVSYGVEEAVVAAVPDAVLEVVLAELEVPSPYAALRMAMTPFAELLDELELVELELVEAELPSRVAVALEPKRAPTRLS